MGTFSKDVFEYREARIVGGNKGLELGSGVSWRDLTARKGRHGNFVWL